MGIPTGITLIVGGGYHGKSTLLSTIEKGIYVSEIYIYVCVCVYIDR